MTELLPHDLDAERAVLGGILIDENQLLSVRQLLKPDDFYDQRHKWILESMLSLRQGGSCIDFTTLAGALQAKGYLGEIGGAAYLANLINHTPTAVHTEHYTRIVARYSWRRQVIVAAGKMAADAYDTSVDDPLSAPAQLISELQRQRPHDEVKGSDWAELAEQIGPIEWAWPGWLPRGFLTMIVAEQEARRDAFRG